MRSFVKLNYYLKTVFFVILMSSIIQHSICLTIKDLKNNENYLDNNILTNQKINDVEKKKIEVFPLQNFTLYQIKNTSINQILDINSKQFFYKN